MSIVQVGHGVFVAGQIYPHQVSQLAEHGFRAIICNRPDGEEAGQPAFSEIRDAAEAAGLKALYIPVRHGPLHASTIEAFRAALQDLPGPVLAYCRSGARSSTLFQAVGDTATG